MVAGQSATVYSANGNEVNAARGATYNPCTGQVNSAGAVVGENGGLAYTNGNVYVGHDGEVSPEARR